MEAGRLERMGKSEEDQLLTFSLGASHLIRDIRAMQYCEDRVLFKFHAEFVHYLIELLLCSIAQRTHRPFK